MRNLPHPHTWEDKQLQSNKYPSTHAPELVPTEQTAGMSGAYVECLIFELAAKLTHCCTYLCAPVKHVYYRRPLSDYICCGESWESQPRRASCCRSSHTHIKTHTHTAHTLFIQRHGGRPSFTHREERQQRWDTGKKSSEDSQTRVSVWAPTAAEVGLFLELWGIHPVNLHNWNATRVST